MHFLRAASHASYNTRFCNHHTRTKLSRRAACSADVRPDERVAALHRLGGAPVSFMILQCCPYVAALHTLGRALRLQPALARPSHTKPGIGNEWGDSKSDGSVCLPPRLQPRMDVLTPEGIYIAFNGSSLYVWLGKTCDAACLHEMFGFASVDQADGAHPPLPPSAA